MNFEEFPIGLSSEPSVKLKTVGADKFFKICYDTDFESLPDLNAERKRTISL